MNDARPCAPNDKPEHARRVVFFALGVAVVVLVVAVLYVGFVFPRATQPYRLVPEPAPQETPSRRVST
jgi:energy-converting hydrogenase Eha subunit F